MMATFVITIVIVIVNVYNMCVCVYLFYIAVANMRRSNRDVAFQDNMTFNAFVQWYPMSLVKTK